MGVGTKKGTPSKKGTPIKRGPESKTGASGKTGAPGKTVTVVKKGPAMTRGAVVVEDTGSRLARRTKKGRERMQLLVDPLLLDAAVVSLGAKNKSEAVNAALRNAAENAAILHGLDDAFGSIPDFSYLET
ncbi:MAG: hypothetical protein H7247_01900 [Polaromonas sp.]|nr:hypothetical protein [Gemmatimonadaceae bacterium]